MKTALALLGVFVAVALVALAVPHRPAAAAQQTKVRVGTFRRTELLVAFYRSKRWDQTLRNMMDERRKAKAAGNHVRVKELEAQGQALQERAHRQLAGKATLKEIMEQLQPKLPDVAKQANVRLIVEKPLFHDASVEFVDVTDLLVKHFSPARKKGE